MKSALMVIAPTMFRDEEYAVPTQVLRDRGARVITASTEAGECVGKLGMRATADLSLKDAAEKTWDSVTFVGGAGARVFFDDPVAHKLARHVLEAGGIASAICIGPSTLAHAGLLNGVAATAFSSQESDLVDHGAHFTGDSVSVDGRILTGNGPEAAEQFGVALADLLGLDDE